VPTPEPTPQRDPLDLFRDAWGRVDTPEVPGGGRLAEEDMATQNAVEWTRGAWASVPVPESSLTLARRRGRVLTGRFGVWHAAAAALLVSLSSWIVLTVVNDSRPRSLDLPSEPSVYSNVAMGPIAPLIFEGGFAEPAPARLEIKTDPLVTLMGSDACVCGPQSPFGAPASLVPAIHRDALLQSVIRANRSGSWSDAAKRAQLVLEGAGAAPEVRLAALCQLAFSFQALGQHDKSTAYLSRLEAELTDLRSR